MTNKAIMYIRNFRVIQRSVDDSAFLVDPETDLVFYLNALSTGIWNLLEAPICLDDLIKIVQKAFPELPSQEIDQDVTALIKKMHKKNLIQTKEKASS